MRYPILYNRILATKIPMICLASALVFQSIAAFAEMTENERLALQLSLPAAAVANGSYMSELVTSKKTGPVPNEKPISTYGKAMNLNTMSGASRNDIYVVAPAQDPDPKTVSDRYRNRIVRGDHKEIVIRNHANTVSLEINRWDDEVQAPGMSRYRNVTLSYYVRNEGDRLENVNFFGKDSIVTRLASGEISKNDMKTGREIPFASEQEKAEARKLLSKREPWMKAQSIVIEAPAEAKKVQHYANVLEKDGYKNVTAVEVDRSAHVKKAVADFNKRMGVKGYSKLAASTAAQAAMVGGFLYLGDKKIENLAEVENAPAMRKLEEVEAAKGEK